MRLIDTSASALALLVACCLNSVCTAQSVEPAKKPTATTLLLMSEKQAMEEQHAQLQQILANLVDEKANLQQLQEAVSNKQDEIGVSSEAFNEVIKMLQSQRVLLAIDLAGLDARRDFLRKRLMKCRRCKIRQ